jgi:hypothetical protein
MAHYKDGTAAHLGDEVRGKGYNIPHEVTGGVVGITPGAGSCDLHIVTARAAKAVGTEVAVYATLTEEHGTCADFELLRPSPSRGVALGT